MLDNDIFDKPAFKSIKTFGAPFFKGTAEVSKIITSSILDGARKDLNIVRNNRKKGGINNFRLGVIAYKENRLRSGIIRLWLSSKFSVKSYLPHLYMARCYLKLEKTDKAIYHYILAEKMKPLVKNTITEEIKKYSIYYPALRRRNEKMQSIAQKINQETEGKLNKKSNIVKFFELMVIWIIALGEKIENIFILIYKSFNSKKNFKHSIKTAKSKLLKIRHNLVSKLKFIHFRKKQIKVGVKEYSARHNMPMQKEDRKIMKIRIPQK